MLLIYLCESSCFVNMHLSFFCQKYKFFSILLHSFLLFSVLFYEISIKSIYLLSMYQNLCEFAQHTLFLNVNMKHMVPVIFFFIFFYFPSEILHLMFPPHFFFRLNKVWSMLHHGSVGRVQNKECYFIFSETFLAVFCCLSQWNLFLKCLMDL